MRVNLSARRDESATSGAGPRGSLPAAGASVGGEQGVPAWRPRGRARAHEKRGVALVLVLGMLTILTVLLAEFEDESSSEAAAALADRDALRAEYGARSAVNLGRLVVASEPTIRSAIGPLLGMMLGGGSPQIPVWEFADRMLGAFNDTEGASSFNMFAGVNAAAGRNLGMSGAHFEVMIVDEDSKINLNMAARGDAVSEQRLAMQLLGLMTGQQYDPIFDSLNAEGGFTDRATVCGALIDWADSDETQNLCDPRNSQARGSQNEDGFYQNLKTPYTRKNAAYDSFEELHLVRGVSDDFFSTFFDPDPDNPKRRPVTIWGQGTVNVNSANAQTLYALVCGAAQPNTPMCTDPAQAAKFLMGVNLVRSFVAGAPLFGSPGGFVKAMQGQGMMGQVIKGLLGIEPVQFVSSSEMQKMISTESKMFSIYADGIVNGYRRKTKVRIHAVVDFRNAPPAAYLPGATGATGSATAAATAAPTATSSAAAAASGIAAALAPNTGGTIVYYRIE